MGSECECGSGCGEVENREPNAGPARPAQRPTGARRGCSFHCERGGYTRGKRTVQSVGSGLDYVIGATLDGRCGCHGLYAPPSMVSSRDRVGAGQGRRLFRAVLDPGLMSSAKPVPPQPSQAGPSRSGAMAGKRPLSRINSLTMGTDSPEHAGVPQRRSRSGAANTTTMAVGATASTIESFPSLRDALAAEREEGARQEREARERRVFEEAERRTLYGSKRRRVERAARRAARTFLPAHTTADQRWDDKEQREQREQRAQETVHPASHSSSSTGLDRATAEETHKKMRKLGNGRIGSQEEEAQTREKGPPSSEHSQLSMQSDDGHFQTLFSFHRFASEDEDVGEEHMAREDSSLGSEDGRRVDAACREDGSGMHAVAHAIFRQGAIQGEWLAVHLPVHV